MPGGRKAQDSFVSKLPKAFRALDEQNEELVLSANELVKRSTRGSPPFSDSEISQGYRKV